MAIDGTEPNLHLTPQEMAAVEFTEAVFGGTAKQEAARFFSEVMGLPPKIADQLHGGFSAQLNHVTGWEEKRDVTDALKVLNRVLGAVALPNAVQSPVVHAAPEVVSVPVMPPQSAEKTDTEELDVELAVSPADENDANDDTASAENIGKDEVKEPWELTPKAHAILTKLFGSEYSGQIAVLSELQTQILADSLADMYMGLPSAHLSDQQKAVRAAQFKGIIMGRDADDMKQEFGDLIHIVRSNAESVRGELYSKTPAEDLFTAIETIIEIGNEEVTTSLMEEAS